MTDKNIQESEVADKSSEKRAQISLKMIQLRMKQNKERASLAAQKKSLQKEETMNESFSASQIAALKAEYSKINGIDPASDTYKKLIAMLDRLDLKSLKSLAGAEVKFVSKLAQNRVMRKSMKKEEVESIDELSTNKLADYKKKAGADASAADKAGDMKRGNKRFSGIMKATRKQFGNDSKKEVTEMDNTDSHSGPEREVNPVTNKKRIVYKRHEKKDVKTEELSPKQKEIDKNKNGKIDGFDLSHLRKKNEELSPKQKELDKNKNGKIDGTDLAHLRSKKKLPQGADFAAQRRKERMASTGRMDEEDIQEAVTVKKEKYSWGKMMTVHHGSDTSYPLHPEHQQAIAKLKPGEKTSFKDETNSSVHAYRDGDTVHLTRPRTSSTKTSVAHSHFTEEVEFNIGEESINEKSDYEVYHKDYSGAVQAAIKQAEKRGYEVDMDDWHDKVATGPKKPSSGKTNSFSVNLMKDGKPSKKKLQMQVYNMDNHKYELNMYIEEVQQGVAEGSLNELSKDTLKSYGKKAVADGQASQKRSQIEIGKAASTKDDETAKTHYDAAKQAKDRTEKRMAGLSGAIKRLTKQGVAEAFSNPGSGSTGSSKEDKRIAAALRKKHIPSTPNDKKKGVAEGSDYTPPKLGTVKANLMNTQKPTVQVQVFKRNTLRGDSYWVTKEVKTFKTMDQGQAYVDRINKKGVAEGSISDLLNRDPKSPKFNDHSGPSKTKHSGSIPTPYEQGRLDAHRKKPHNNIHKDKQDAEDYNTGYRHVKSRQGVAEETLSELNKDTLHSYAKKSEKDQDDQFNKIGKGIRDNDPKSANKAGHKFSMRSIGQNRAEKRLAKEAASPAQQAAIAIAMKKAGKKPKDMKEGIVDKIKAIKRGMQAKAKADDHFDKAGDPKNANASKDLKKAVRYHNLVNKEEVVLEAKKPKSFKDVKKKMKEEEKPNKSTVKKGDMLTGKKEPIEINPEIKESKNDE